MATRRSRQDTEALFTKPIDFVTLRNEIDGEKLFREYNIAHGVPKAQAYNVTMYIMAGLFVIGFICNLLIKAVDKRFHMKPDSTLATAAEAGREISRR